MFDFSLISAQSRSIFAPTMIGIQQQTLQFPVRKSARQASKSNMKAGIENSPQLSNELDALSQLSVNSPRTRSRASRSTDSPVSSPKAVKAGGTPKSTRTRRSVCKAAESVVLFDAMQSKSGMDISLNILPKSPPSSPRKRTPCKGWYMLGVKLKMFQVWLCVLDKFQYTHQYMGVYKL